MLVDFQQFHDIHHLIPQILDPARDFQHPDPIWTQSAARDHCHQIEDSDKWELYVKYHKIVSQVLIDQNGTQIPLNSQHFYLIFWSVGHQEQYVSLANYLLRYLNESPPGR